MMKKDQLSTIYRLGCRKKRKDSISDFFKDAWKMVYEDGFVYRYIRDNFDIIEKNGMVERNLLSEYTGSWYYHTPKQECSIVRKKKLEQKDIGGWEHMEIGPRFVCTYDNVSIVGPSGLGLSPNGEIIVETVGNPNAKVAHVSRSIAHSIGQNGLFWTYKRLKSGAKEDTSKKNSVFETACLLLPLFKNYYHWTIECLPRVRGVELYSEQTREVPTYIIPENMSSWMYDSLKLAGVDINNCVEWNERESYISTLVIPSYPEPTPTECRWLKKRMYDSVEINSSETIPEKYIYISREDATKRRVRNEDELMSSLSEYGFERYLLSELSVAEQVELFSKAEIVLSPHGAGLTNIIYAPDDVTVIELFGDRKKNTFYRIADMLDYEYRYIDCNHDSVDIIVDVDRIEREVQSLVDNQ